MGHLLLHAIASGYHVTEQQNYWTKFPLGPVIWDFTPTAPESTLFSNLKVQGPVVQSIVSLTNVSG